MTRLQRYMERRARNQKIKRERQYAARAKDAKVYYQVPNATAKVLGSLVEWRKGERCKPFNRSNRWATFDETMMQINAHMLDGAAKYGSKSWLKLAQLAQGYGGRCPTRQGHSS